jgi:hypothetical protein
VLFEPTLELLRGGEELLVVIHGGPAYASPPDTVAA